MDLTEAEVRFTKCLNSILDQGAGLFSSEEITLDFMDDDVLVIRGHACQMSHSSIVPGPVLIHTYGYLQFQLPRRIDDQTVEEFIIRLLCIPHRFLSHRTDIGDHKRIGLNPFES